MAYGNDWLESLMELTNHIEKTEGRDAAYKFAMKEIEAAENTTKFGFTSLITGTIVAVGVIAICL